MDRVVYLAINITGITECNEEDNSSLLYEL